MNHVESTTKVYESWDYGAFKILKGNREIDKAKIQKIADDIKNDIDILDESPIIINSSIEIIDGQHRFCVAKLLKRKISYIIKPEATLSTVPAINSKASKWRNIDFLNSYVALKKEEYGDLKVFLTKYPRISIAVAVSIYHKGYPNDKETLEIFQAGGLKNTHRDTAFKLAYVLKEFEPYTINPFSRRMFNAIMQLLDNKNYDHDLMMRKLKESGRRIEKIESTKSIIEEMESIINFKSRARIYIS